jgi:hypothetical protein
VKVCAGTDPVSGKRHDLIEVIPAGPTAQREAQKALRRLLTQLDERRSPPTRATVDQLMDRYMEVLDVKPATRAPDVPAAVPGAGRRAGVRAAGRRADVLA